MSGGISGLGAALNEADDRASHCEGPLMDEHRQGVGMQQQTANAARKGLGRQGSVDLVGDPCAGDPEFDSWL